MASAGPRNGGLVTSAPFRDEIQSAVADLESQFGAAAIAELLEIFLDESVSLLRGLQSALRDGDLVAAASRAHGLKSIAGNFGMSAIVQTATLIEKGAKTGTDGRTLLRLFDELSSDTMAAREIIRELLRSSRR